MEDASFSFKTHFRLFKKKRIIHKFVPHLLKKDLGHFLKDLKHFYFHLRQNEITYKRVI